jgi:hypothetical protein
MNAYKVAVNEKYRFFSFGDAMFICWSCTTILYIIISILLTVHKLT